MLLGELLSLGFVITNIIISVFVLIPQMYLNYKIKSSKAISILLLIDIFWGGIMSLVSAILKQASMSIIYIGIHFTIINIIFLSQVIYYRIFTFNEKILIFILSIICFGAIISTLVLQTEISINLLAWSASFLFCISKFPQIYLNYKRGTVDGLSFATFSTMLFTNICFISSILINAIDKQKPFIDLVILNIQWISSSLISMCASFVILYQFYYYKEKGPGYIVIDEETDFFN